jgi:hypothetical protein
MNFQNEYNQVMEIAPSRRAFYSSFTAISYFFWVLMRDFYSHLKGKLCKIMKYLMKKYDKSNRTKVIFTLTITSFLCT